MRDVLILDGVTRRTKQAVSHSDIKNTEMPKVKASFNIVFGNLTPSSSILYKRTDSSSFF